LGSSSGEVLVLSVALGSRALDETGGTIGCCALVVI